MEKSGDKSPHSIQEGYILEGWLAGGRDEHRSTPDICMGKQLKRDSINY